MLGIAALVLAGRLLADSRTRERELLTALGLSPGQQLGAALVESVLLAAVSAVVAVPAAAVAYAAVTRLPEPAGRPADRGPDRHAGPPRGRRRRVPSSSAWSSSCRRS